METSKQLTQIDYMHLRQCLTLAKEALDAGDSPFGSILVNAKNEVIATARNLVNQLNVLAHPEIELANWAADNLTEEERKATTMYTSGEHCPMCGAAHGWVGIGTLVYLSSGKQLTAWLLEFGVAEAPIHFIPVEKIVKSIIVKGPAEGELLKTIKAFQKIYYVK
jgi:tRNA(Arg) A34 adenosine deaminase TadA